MSLTLKYSGCCWTSRLMAPSTSARWAGRRFAQNVSGVPLPYWQDAVDGEGAVEGAVDGDGAAAVGDGCAGELGEDEPPEQDNDVATSTTRTEVRLRTRMIAFPPGRSPGPAGPARGAGPQ